MATMAAVMKPGLQRVRTHSKPGFMTSRRTRGAQIVVLAVPVLPEPDPGFPGSRRGQPAAGRVAAGAKTGVAATSLLVRSGSRAAAPSVRSTHAMM